MLTLFRMCMDVDGRVRRMPFRHRMAHLGAVGVLFLVTHWQGLLSPLSGMLFARH
ncbi:hypothetical protein [Parachitinimonas caeni]|uniref:Uncharacterized protein n=1 Tax=Parachitinimonas caeni TaxID=3031301 RepID=A0ABT7E122_9NEIS|nr:hypothetical protein [Parachitinimonas caeni]MDK2126022.1 hypothetical protein [Parachitinimonas caeni]